MYGSAAPVRSLIHRTVSSRRSRRSLRVRCGLGLDEAHLPSLCPSAPGGYYLCGERHAVAWVQEEAAVKWVICTGAKRSLGTLR